jgi:subtilisin family serine protease
VVRCQASGAIPERVMFTMQGGAVPELDLANALSKALDNVPTPRVISMSAGCHTYNDQPLKAFEDLWSSKLADMPDTVLVAAAGNDSSPRPFYPAASWWAIGVGSLDFDDRISSYSNYGDSADVFVLGRNHINAFPHGQYVCQWPPDEGGVREFRTGLARWSGTSFSTPLLAGRIAAYLTEPHPPGAPTDATLLARDLIDGLVDQGFAEPYGNYRYIGRQHWPV